jgi:hypothetical protein
MCGGGPNIYIYIDTLDSYPSCAAILPHKDPFNYPNMMRGRSHDTILFVRVKEFEGWVWDPLVGAT